MVSKGEVTLGTQKAHQTGAFCSTNQLGLSLLPLDGKLVHCIVTVSIMIGFLNGPLVPTYRPINVGQHFLVLGKHLKEETRVEPPTFRWEIHGIREIILANIFLLSTVI